MEEFDITQIRNEFPILNRRVWDKPMVYLDSAATSFTPTRVVKEIERVYATCKANVHRGVHTLSQEATDLQEATRESVREFINASSTQEIIFTRGTTEAINLVASSYGDLLLLIKSLKTAILPLKSAMGDIPVSIIAMPTPLPVIPFSVT